jgi:tRNA threonylcarbamoyladenosine biosynthesis protein TsaE
MHTYHSNSDTETKNIAKDLAKKITSGVIALTGDLGAGKTTFTQGFAEGLEITDKVISPTFVLIRQHKIPNTQKTLFHIDLYRLEEPINIQDLGIADLLDTKDDLVLIEWAEKIEKLLPKDTIRINIEILGENKRKITVTE